MRQTNLSWKRLPATTTPRAYSCATYVDGKLFLVGGYSNGVLNSAEYFNLDAGRWTQVPSIMSAGRYAFAAAAIGNSIYVAGGHDGRSGLGSVEAYNVVDGSRRRLPPLSTERTGCAGAAVGDEFFVFGGWSGSSRLNTAEVFNVKTEEWEELPPMNTSRFGCATAVIKNKIFVVGGQDGFPFDTVEVFDTTTRTWTLLPNRMRTRRYACDVAAVGNLLVVVGGYDGTSSLNTVEVYDVDAETWTELPSMAAKRSGCAAVALGGAVYVVGGREGSVFHDSVEQIQFSDDVVRNMLVEWSGGSWGEEVASILHWRTSIVHRMDVDVSLMPNLLSSAGRGGRVQTIFGIVRGAMPIFKQTAPKR